MKSHRVAILLLALMMILSACNLPSAKPTEQVNPNAVFTAAAQTVEVQLTQNSLLNPTKPVDTLAPPTNTPTPPALERIIPIGTLAATNTSAPPIIPTTACDAAQFVADVSVPDGTTFDAGATFTKTWRFKNIGTCTWNNSYSLVFDSGDAMGGPTSQNLTGTTAPNGFLEVSVNLQAPSKDGTYRGYWGLKNASGARVPVAGGTNGRSFYVEIKVGSGASGDATDSPGKFAVTSVSFSVSRSESCSSASGKYVITATVTVNKAGNVTYNWVRSDGATGPGNNGTLSFSQNGSKTVTYEWNTTATGLWVELYIDNPNHQQFGRATLNCP
ncbi:MAG TPA: NBR1-Ig-like domain-containing protein [Anaerolineales bacterium]